MVSWCVNSDLLELFSDGAERFAAIANQLAKGLLPDPAAALH